MLIAAVLTLCASAATAVLALWSVARIPADGSAATRESGPASDPSRRVLRAVAPTQLAAAVMLAAGGAIALAAPPHVGVLLLVMCIVGAVGTFAVGCYQSAKALARHEATTADAGCGGACASCTLSCD